MSLLGCTKWLVLLQITSIILLVCVLSVNGDTYHDAVDTSLTNDTGILSLDNKADMFSVKLTEEMDWKDTSIVTTKVYCTTQSMTAYKVTVRSRDIGVVKVIGESTSLIECCSKSVENQSLTDVNSTTHTSVTTEAKFHLYAEFLGQTYLDVLIYPCFENASSDWMMDSNETNASLPVHSGQYEVTVVNKETVLSRVFIIGVAVMMVILNFGFGCRIRVDIVKSILKKPVAPILGLACQFVVMPLLGVGLSQLLPFPSSMGFGLFVTATAPGGGGSNVWTVMLDGDLDLSMTMTFFSKTLALFIMPTWMFALSRIYVTDRKIRVSYLQLVTGLISLALPCVLGIILKKYKPHLAKRMSRIIKPLSVLFILWVIIIGSITNLYIYTLMSTQWYVITGGCLLPYLGMIFGFIIAKVACQPLTRVIAISLETGIQDTGVAILLLLATFEKPIGSLAATMPITSGLFTPIPLIVCVIGLALHNRSCSMKEDDEKDSPKHGEVNETKVMYSDVAEEDVLQH